jgi:hypothetical protein
VFQYSNYCSYMEQMRENGELDVRHILLRDWEVKLRLLYTTNYRSHAVLLGFVETAASRSGYSETQVRGPLNILPGSRTRTRTRATPRPQLTFGLATEMSIEPVHPDVNVSSSSL